MKISFLSFCLLASSVFLFTECKKDDTPSANTPANYSPLTVGSNWTYNYTEGTSSPDMFTLTVTDKDTVVSGKTYKVLSSSDESGNNYLAKIDSNYYRFASFPGIGSFEELYLKDNLPVNGTWRDSTSFSIPGSPVPLTADLTYFVKEKGISHIVNGKTYNDVIHINVTISVFSLSFGGGDFYYAKDVGMIANNILLTPPGEAQFTSKQELESHEIK